VLLDQTTDVAEHPEFTDRYTWKMVDGVNTTGYFVSDFLFSELQTLRLNQRLANRTILFNGYFTIPKFDDIMSLAQSTYTTTGRMIGIYPELKHPSFFNSLGFKMEDMFLESLVAGGYAVNGENAYADMNVVVPVVVQCFDPLSLKYLRTKSSLPLIQLVYPPTKPEDVLKFLTGKDLTDFATYANGVGPHKLYFDPALLKQVEAFITQAHSMNLLLHPWTMRADSEILPVFNGNFEEEERYFYQCLRVDAAFSEFPDRTRETVDSVIRLDIMMQRGKQFLAGSVHAALPSFCSRFNSSLPSN